MGGTSNNAGSHTDTTFYVLPCAAAPCGHKAPPAALVETPTSARCHGEVRWYRDRSGKAYRPLTVAARRRLNRQAA